MTAEAETQLNTTLPSKAEVLQPRLGRLLCQCFSVHAVDMFTELLGRLGTFELEPIAQMSQFSIHLNTWAKPGSTHVGVRSSFSIVKGSMSRWTFLTLS